MYKLNYNGTNLYINSFIPFHEYIAMIIFSMILYRKEYESYLYDSSYFGMVTGIINHENIHKEQIKDFGLLFKWCKPIQILIGGLIFYLIYLFEWLIRLFINGPSNAYKNISFEREAYKYELDYGYIQKERKHFNQWRKNK